MFLKIAVEDIGVGDNLEDDHLSDDSDDDDTTTMTNHHWPWCVYTVTTCHHALQNNSYVKCDILLGFTIRGGFYISSFHYI